MPNGPRAWRWARKAAGRTVTLGLTPAKVQRMKRAIANHRILEKVIIKMREITQKLILGSSEPTPVPTKQLPSKPPLS